MDKIEDRWRKGNTRKLRDCFSFSHAQGAGGIHLGEVRGPRQGAEVDFSRVLVTVGGLECGVPLTLPVGVLLEMCGCAGGQF